ncbi:MAG: amino acid permease [Pseudomonadota bacterium]
MSSDTTLKRTLNYPLLTFYGLGSIVGAGIYVLIGEVAGQAGTSMGFSFLLAGVVAGLAGAGYAELSSRFPQSAGAALYVDIAFNQPWFSRVVAALLVFTGIVSSATICQGFVGYLQLYVDLGDLMIISGLCIIMFAIASWGIKESAVLIAVITTLEVAGLVIVMVVAGDLEPRASLVDVVDVSAGVGAIAAGAFLAFYAFIGFEDMVNVAEEVKEPEKNMPRGILSAVILSTLLYIAMAVVAVVYIDLLALSESKSPLALMVGHNDIAMNVIGIISMMAIVNGALVQIIMSARVMYGMAVRGHLPAVFALLNARTQTPVINTLITTGLIWLLAAMLPLVTLAAITSTLMLFIFIIVNIGLLRIKRMPEHAAHTGFQLPIWIPALSAGCTALLLVYQLFN